MGDFSARNFGLLIAYLIPGFVILLGLSYPSEAVRAWLLGAGPSGPGVGSALYVLIASVACGMTASAVRWALVDTFHHNTGLKKPLLDESRLPEKLEAFDYLVENHYRYYQFYGNTLIASLAAYAAWRWSAAAAPVGIVEAGLLVLVIVFAISSRDALSKYYTRSMSLLGTLGQEISHDERQQAAPRAEDHQDGKPKDEG